jgi:adenine/guanine phosphoribosyltransferase-like PRPP-binding protein
MENYFKELIRNVPDFPKKGIMFRDITTLLKDRVGIKKCADALYKFSGDQKIDKVVGIDSRGFYFWRYFGIYVECWICHRQKTRETSR